MNKIISVGCAVLIAALFSCNSSSRFITNDKSWLFLGERKVSHLKESDVIQVKSREKFTALRLYVSERPIEIKYVEVTLINGDVLRPVIENTIPAGEQSRMIELGAEGRQLDHITLRYRASGKIFSKKAVIQVGGKPL
ncbi:MAG TPA: hypothetical protein VK666_17495 [Chryseolinea sp.]|nr:hypothetical protein [Chryseolinea sp.]